MKLLALPIDRIGRTNDRINEPEDIRGERKFLNI